MNTSSRRTVLVLVLAIAASGCFAITDLDRFEPGDAAGERRDLTVHLCGFRTHLLHRFQVNVLTGPATEPSPQLLGRAVFLPLGGQDANFIMPGVLPPGPAHLTFFADVNGSGTLDPPPPMPVGGDHQWRFDIPASGDFRYVHEAVFTPIAMPAPQEPGADFRLTVTNAEGEMGSGADMPHFLEVRVTRYVGGNPVATEGLARVVIIEGSFEVVIPGVIRPVEEYRVDYYVDRNRDRVHNALLEHSWRQDNVVSTTTSLTLEASLGTDPTFEINLVAPTMTCPGG